MTKAGRDGNNHGLWAEGSPGGSTMKGKAECRPYDCRELEAFLREHPEMDNPMIRAYMAKQRKEAV